MLFVYFLYTSGDGRNDSPGHCAQYLTYTIMENDTKDVLHVEVMDKRQAGMVSGRMEPKALMKSLDSLKADNMKVAEMVTDAHTVVTCRMSKSTSYIITPFIVYQYLRKYHHILIPCVTCLDNHHFKCPLSRITMRFNGGECTREKNRKKEEQNT